MNKIPKFMFFSSLAMVLFCFGILSEKFNLLPAAVLKSIVKDTKTVISSLQGELPWFYLETSKVDDKVITAKTSQTNAVLLTVMGPDLTPEIKILDSDSQLIHSWKLDWFSIWPDASHLPKVLVPQQKPGTHVHGSKILPDGSIIYNFENLGLVKLDVCGGIVWRLPALTHHSVFIDEEQFLWVPGQIRYTKNQPQYTNVVAPFKDDTILKITPSGEIVETISVIDLLKANNLEGLIYLSTNVSRDTKVSGDLFHLNDVEIFPTTMDEGVFRHGDVLISLRNINTVIVFSPTTLKVRFISTGQVTRQHDPDFIDGNTISVFDNNHVSSDISTGKSKIVLLNAKEQSVDVYFEGSANIPFYTNIMGKHQWLSNGELMIVESMKGQAFQLTKDLEVSWKYLNKIDDDSKLVGIMEGAERINDEFNLADFNANLKNCTKETYVN